MMQTFPVKILTLIEMVIFILVGTKIGLFPFLLAA
jgi:UPF0716 family protein affecting phage T7 exclusion